MTDAIFPESVVVRDWTRGRDAYRGRVAVRRDDGAYALNPQIRSAVIDAGVADKAARRALAALGGERVPPLAREAEWIALSGDDFSLEDLPCAPSYDPALQALTFSVPAASRKHVCVRVGAKLLRSVPAQRGAFAHQRWASALRAAGLVRDDGTIRWADLRAAARSAVDATGSAIPASKSLRSRLCTPELDARDQVRLASGAWFVLGEERADGGAMIAAPVNALDADADGWSVDGVVGAALDGTRVVTARHRIRGALVRDAGARAIGAVDVEDASLWHPWSGFVDAAPASTTTRCVFRITEHGCVERAIARAHAAPAPTIPPPIPLSAQHDTCALTLRPGGTSPIVALRVRGARIDVANGTWVRQDLVNLRAPAARLTVLAHAARDEIKRGIASGAIEIDLFTSDASVARVAQTRVTGSLHAFVPRALRRSDTVPGAMAHGELALLPPSAPQMVGRAWEPMTAETFARRFPDGTLMAPAQFDYAEGRYLHDARKHWCLADAVAEAGECVTDFLDPQNACVLSAEHNGARFAFGGEGFALDDVSQRYVILRRSADALARSVANPTVWLALDRAPGRIRARDPFEVDAEDAPIVLEGTMINVRASGDGAAVQILARASGVAPPTAAQIVGAGCRVLGALDTIERRETPVLFALRHDMPSTEGMPDATLRVEFEDPHVAKQALHSLPGTRAALRWVDGALDVRVPAAALSRDVAVLLFGASRPLRVLDVTSETFEATMGASVEVPFPVFAGDASCGRIAAALRVGDAEAIVDVRNKQLHLDGTPARSLAMEKGQTVVLRRRDGGEIDVFVDDSKGGFDVTRTARGAVAIRARGAPGVGATVRIEDATLTLLIVTHRASQS